MSAALRQMVEDVRREGSIKTRTAGRLMSLVENDPKSVPALLSMTGDTTLPRLVLGITGPPGAGKSTLIDALVTSFRARHADWKIGVIAVDPTSPMTGGAVLGDRARMMRHAGDPNVFIRSLASRGRLGGLTAGARGVVAVMTLLGFDVVVVETVGVGQNEVEVAQVADLTAIVVAPGLGDDLQLLKAGVLEVGDLIIVNKADRPGADELQRQVLAWRRMRGSLVVASATPSDSDEATKRRSHGRTDALFMVSATTGAGVAELVGALESAIGEDASVWRSRRCEAVARHVQDTVLHEGMRRLRETARGNGVAAASVEGILGGKVSVDQAVDDLLRRAIDAD